MRSHLRGRWQMGQLDGLEQTFYNACVGRVQYIEATCKSALNRVQGMPFKWSLNPYRGCVHACHYCYARASHTYYDMNADEDFETKIVVKVNFPEVLRQELRRPSWARELVALGTVTDCYQPAEGRYRITRRVLEALLERRNPMSMVTKSPMVLRDRDVLARLAHAAPVRIAFTITTVDQKLWRAMEPGTANPLKRLRVMRLLNEAGVASGVILAPILPGITDSDEGIDSVAAAAAEHGAAFFWANALRLAPYVKEHYLGFLEQSFPDLLPLYQQTYPGTYAPREYVQKLDQRIDSVRQRYGFEAGGMRYRDAGGQPSALRPPRQCGEQLALPI